MEVAMQELAPNLAPLQHPDSEATQKQLILKVPAAQETCSSTEVDTLV
jgi:hypothetical protein